MRLLLVTDAYPPLIGGADRQTQMLAAAMSAAGHEVAVATPWQPGLLKLELEGRVEVFRFRGLVERIPGFAGDPARHHHPPFPDPLMSLRLRRLVRRFRPDVVHSYGWISYSMAVALIGTRVPMVLSARDYGSICAVRNLLHVSGALCSGPAPLKCLACASATYATEAAGNAVQGRSGQPIGLRHRLLGGAKGIAAVGGVYLGQPLLRHGLRELHAASRFVREVMVRHLLRGSAGRIPTVVIPNFVRETAEGSAEASVLDRLPAEPFILFVGALIPGKGIWPLLEAYRRVRGASPATAAPPLVLLGPATPKSPSSLPAGVLAVGSGSQATVLAAWDRALFGVVPSVVAETFGNVVTEGMSRGRAIVASRIGGIVDIIEDGRSGLLVPPGEPAALADVMQRLIDEPDLRTALGAGARRRVERFAASRVLPDYEALYARAAAPARTADPDPAAAQPHREGLG